MKPLAYSIIALLGSCAILPAATSFTEDFAGLNDGPNLALGAGYGSPTTDFSAQKFTITSGTSSRIYLGTINTDYSAVDFVFQATVFIPNNNAWAIAFLGMGSSTAGTSTVSGEPVTGSNLFMAVRNDGVASPYLEGRDMGVGSGTNKGNIPGIVGGTHLLRMTWTASSKSALFEFDTGNNGSIDGSFTLDGSNNSFTGSNSQLVLGGGNGLVFDDVSVSVVPEPSAAVLGGLGMLGLLRRRRRRG